MKNPKWNREEIILTLAFYHKYYPSIPEKSSNEIKDLSKLLRKLSDSNNEAINLKYRNENGVYMKLMNFHHLNPNHFGKGLHAASKLDSEIFSEFENNLEQLKYLSNKIIKSLD